MKVVDDGRGYLGEVAPRGLVRSHFPGGVKNVYVSTAKMGEVRAGHYHLKLIETFITVSGRALWYFHDMRSRSKSQGATFGCLAGFSTEESSGLRMPIDVGFSEILVPSGVYHVFYALSPVTTVLAFASLGYDPKDYVRLEATSFQEFSQMIKAVEDEAGIGWEGKGKSS